MTCKQIEVFARKAVIGLIVVALAIYLVVVGGYGWLHYGPPTYPTPVWIQLAQIFDLAVIGVATFLLVGNWLDGTISFCREKDE